MLLTQAGAGDLGRLPPIAIIYLMASRLNHLKFLVLGGVLILLSACSSQISPTPTIAWTPLPVASSQPIPTPTPTEAAPEAIRPSANCLNDARFIEDLTIPDQTVVQPGVELDKRWSIQNNGSCDWGPGYRLLRMSSDGFQSTGEIALYPASAGSIAVWQVQLVAPNEPGEHISIWQARAPDGAMFGEQVYLWVIVATPMPTPTMRGTPTN